VKKLPYRRQLFELNALVTGENKLLEKLIGEREIEAAEVVAVNIGKKKKRIKKNDPLIETDIDVNKAKIPVPQPKSARTTGQTARPAVKKGKK